MPTPFAIEHLLELRSPTVRMPFHLSPDGRLLVVGIQRRTTAPRGRRFDPTGVPREMAGSSVAVIDTGTGHVTYPFPESSVSWCGRWSPDGRVMAAFVQHEGVACVGVWDRESGEHELLRQAPVMVRYGFDLPRWLPDGSGLVAALWPEGVAYPEPGVAPVATQPIQVRRCGPGVEWVGLPEHLRNVVFPWDLGVIDLASGAVARPVTDLPVGSFFVSPDGGSVALMCYESSEERLQQPYHELTVVDLASGERRRLAPRLGNAFGINANWSPDGARIAYTTSERGQPARLFVATADGSREPRCLTEGQDIRLLLKYEAPRWSQDSAHVSFLTANEWWRVGVEDGAAHRTRMDDDLQLMHWVVRPGMATMWEPERGTMLALARRDTDGQECLVQVGPNGHPTSRAEIPGRCTSDIWRMEVDEGSGRCFLMVEGADRPSEVWTLSGAELRRLWALNAGLGDVSLGKARPLSYNAKGDRLKATLLVPVVGEPPYPTVVSVYAGNIRHGGPERFGMEGTHPLHPQLLCGKGYAVLCPDIPIAGTDPLPQICEPVLRAVEQAVTEGLVDEHRVGVMGASFGGYTVAVLVTQTDRFGAALAHAPFGIHMLSAYRQQIGWCETGQGGMGGSPWERLDAYIENSPFLQLDRVTTPLLLTCGTEDATGTQQAEEAFVGLERLGKVAELRTYHGEGHGTSAWSAVAQRDLWSRAAEWFDQHLAKED